MGHYYKRLRELREDNDLTQQQVADILNVGLTTYRRWEVGDRTILTNVITDLCKLYKVSADYILGLTDNPEPNKTTVNKQVNISGKKNKVGDITIK